MVTSDLHNQREINPMMIPAEDVPHIAIEPTMRCNIQCRICYNLSRNYEKSLDEICAEIDLARAKRNLDTISLLGGEPTLHPDIVQIIRYIRSCGLHCQLLTNGITLLEDTQNLLLDQLVYAGVDRILLHMDSGQSHVHHNIEENIYTLFTKFEKRKIAFSLVITIYDDNLDRIPLVLRKYAKFKYFDGILGTLERDARLVMNRIYTSLTRSNLLKVYNRIHQHMRIEPTTYLPTSLDNKNISWLFYFYYINAESGKTFMISPTLNKWFRKIYRLLSGHHVFGMTVNQTFKSLMFLITALLELLIHPYRIGDLLRLLKDSSMLKFIRFHYIVIQDGPRYNVEKDCLEICYHCPDATIRNGIITPVCLADRINPLVPDEYRSDASYTAGMIVYEHLEEI
jgi:organic radical activating enzyme